MRHWATLAGAGLLLVGHCVFACERQPVHFQAAAMSERVVERKLLPLQGHYARLAGTIELLVVVDENGRPNCILVVRGHPLLTSVAVESVKDWRFRPMRKKRRSVPYSGSLVIDAKEFARPD